METRKSRAIFAFYRQSVIDQIVAIRQSRNFNNTMFCQQFNHT